MAAFACDAQEEHSALGAILNRPLSDHPNLDEAKQAAEEVLNTERERMVNDLIATGYSRADAIAEIHGQVDAA